MEQKFISWLEQYLSNSDQSPNVLLGVGDDGALVKGGDHLQVIVADIVVDQVHFDLGRHELRSIGHKAIAVNLSDIAAMGAVPETAIVTLTLPRSMTFEQAKSLMLGVAETAGKYGVSIIGGDTCRHDGPLSIGLTVTGQLQARFKCPHGWRMSGAQVGDRLFVTGSLGGSIAGKHLDFDPKIEFAKAVQERAIVNAATDISDSLAIDLAHVIRKSSVGAVLEVDSIPVSEAAKNRASETGTSPLEHALYDGEDFELLLSMTSSEFEVLDSDPDFEFEMHQIGFITADHPGEIFDSASKQLIEVRGYEH